MNRRSLMKAIAALGAVAAAGKAWATGASVPAAPALTMDDFNRLAAAGTAEKWAVIENLRFDLLAPPRFRDLEYVRVHRCKFTFPESGYDGSYLYIEGGHDIEINHCIFEMLSPNKWQFFRTAITRIPDTHIGKLP